MSIFRVKILEVVTYHLLELVICVENIENLIPEILMESEHFYLVHLDVEGNVLNSNKRFIDTVEVSMKKCLLEALNRESQASFEVEFDNMLSSPKSKHQLLLSLVGKEKVLPVWWEFSVITTPEMDILGVFGLGVDFKMLQYETPWHSLSDLLDFGSVVLDERLQTLSLDEKVRGWLEVDVDKVQNLAFFSEVLVPVDVAQLEKLNRYKRGKTPCAIRLKNCQNGEVFSSLLIYQKSGNQLFLMPEMKKTDKIKMEKPFNESQLAAIPGSVWLVKKDLTLVQLNEDGQLLGQEWFGKSLEEGAKLCFENESMAVGKLLEKVAEVFCEQQPSEFDLRLKNNSSDFGFWKVNISLIQSEIDGDSFAMIHLLDLSEWGKKLMSLQKENNALREVAMKPSHILRSPLSSMMGLLDLIDPQQLDTENQKYFSYLKPLAKELDEVIRNNAKKVGAFD